MTQSQNSPSVGLCPNKMKITLSEISRLNKKSSMPDGITDSAAYISDSHMGSKSHRQFNVSQKGETAVVSKDNSLNDLVKLNPRGKETTNTT